MPYVITAKQYDDPYAHDPKLVGLSRVAVATLEDARKHCLEETVRTHAWGYGSQPFISASRALPESGGTIGPLPDGTIIEVMAVCWNWIIGVADDRGLDTDALYDDGGDMAILAAFNAS